ncbi:NAD(P)-dependent oxidoreductase [Streptomyces polygonati]|uniref:NAD(P)-dependent oxidoreductase n=1 Tax=Streptomyces polygonati TaxID=1617087 RepID=A0ABV8HND9_9ACTN
MPTGPSSAGREPTGSPAPFPHSAHLPESSTVRIDVQWSRSVEEEETPPGVRPQEFAMAKVGFVGLGDMGSRMVPHLLRAGHEAVVFDILPERIHDMAALGAVAADSPAAVARETDVVISSVMSDDIPAAHWEQDGILAGMRPGSVLAVLSTTTPEMLRAVASRLPDGAGLVDAPLIGGVRYASEAKLTVLLAGPDDAMNLTEPVLATFGDVVRVGPLGSGVAYKLITNVIVMAAEAGLREALDLADTLNCSYDTTLDLLARGPMAAVVKRAADRDNPRAIRASAVDFDVLLSAGGEDLLPISAAGRRRLWAAVEAASPPPVFFDLTTHATALPPYRAA